MLRVGQKEIDAIARVLLSGKVFRYDIGGECGRFERRFARYLGVKHATLCSSGTAALTAALVGVGVGPGEEVLVPACTYMATAISVLAAGAIPVVVDIDESLGMDPEAAEDAIGPRTRAIVPVHMWGLPCDMAPLMGVARRHKVLVVEDVSQAVGGGYRGRKLGSFGRAAGFSFNYYKNITCGEGGAVVTKTKRAAQRAWCMIDCCRFYWKGHEKAFTPFVANGSRASELEGAMLNAQLDRLDGMLRATRRQKKRILRETAATGLRPIKANSLDDECGTHVMFILPTNEKAEEFARLAGGHIAGKTGRHVYTDWDPIIARQGAHHPALNPFELPENKGCRVDFSPERCRRSLDILNRTVIFATHPDRRRAEVTALIRKIRSAAKAVLGDTGEAQQ